ncbi:hypothetical protein ACU4GD_22095 [Cupriavidus basilensis]
MTVENTADALEAGWKERGATLPGAGLRVAGGGLHAQPMAHRRAASCARIAPKSLPDLLARRSKAARWYPTPRRAKTRRTR